MSYTLPPDLVQKYRDAAAEAVTLEAFAVLAVAKPLTPYEHGDLEASGEVITFWIGDVFYAVVGFGGTPETAQYAEIQHENMSYNHLPGRQAKYLEVPALAATPGMGERVAAFIASKVA